MICDLVQKLAKAESESIRCLKENIAPNYHSDCAASPLLIFLIPTPNWNKSDVLSNNDIVKRTFDACVTPMHHSFLRILTETEESYRTHNTND